MLAGQHRYAERAQQGHLEQVAPSRSEPRFLPGIATINAPPMATSNGLGRSMSLRKRSNCPRPLADKFNVPGHGSPAADSRVRDEKMEQIRRLDRGRFHRLRAVLAWIEGQKNA